jgi:hypothetical protein
MANTLECVNNVPFKGGSPHFHKTKLKDGKRSFGLKLGPTFFHVQNKTILGLLCSVLGWHLESFTKPNKGNRRAIELNAWLWGFSFTLKGNNVRIEKDYIKTRKLKIINNGERVMLS